MTAPTCVLRTARTVPDVVLGLSDSEEERPEGVEEEEDEDDDPADDDEDDEESSCDYSNGDVCVNGLSSESSSVSDGREASPSPGPRPTRTPPRTPPARRARVAKRSLRDELLDRWPGWTSPARKRLRSASPEAVALADDCPSGPAARRLWRLVGRIAATSTPSLPDDCQRLCGHQDPVATSPPAWTSTGSLLRPGRQGLHQGDGLVDDGHLDGPRVCHHHSRRCQWRGRRGQRAPLASPWPGPHLGPSPRPSSCPSPNCLPGPAADGGGTTENDEHGIPEAPTHDFPRQRCSHQAAIAAMLPPPTWPSRLPGLAGLPSRIPAASEDTLSSSLASLGSCILPPPTPFSGSPAARLHGQHQQRAARYANHQALLAPAVAAYCTCVPVHTPPTWTAQVADELCEVCVEDARRPAAQDADAMQRLLAGCPLGALTGPTGTEASSGCPAGPPSCPGEDSSVLQLLVLTPTEESKGCPDPSATRGQCRWSLTKPATRVKLRNAADFLLRVKVPYFIIMVSIFEVTMYAVPTPFEAQEMKNVLVWDSNELFRQPWRVLTYSMMHSGQVHLSLNVAVQSILGVPLEREQGPWRVALVYWLGAVFGALGTGVVSPGLQMLGASAGIYALLLSHLAQIWLNAGKVRHGKKRAAAVLLMACADVAFTLHHALHRNNVGPRISVTAHAAGALSGLPLGLAVYAPHPHPSHGDGYDDDDDDDGDPRMQRRHLRARVARLASALLLVAAAVFCPVWIYLAGARVGGAASTAGAE